MMTQKESAARTRRPATVVARRGWLAGSIRRRLPQLLQRPGGESMTGNRLAKASPAKEAARRGLKGAAAANSAQGKCSPVVHQHVRLPYATRRDPQVSHAAELGHVPSQVVIVPVLHGHRKNKNKSALASVRVSTVRVNDSLHRYSFMTSPIA